MTTLTELQDRIIPDGIKKIKDLLAGSQRKIASILCSVTLGASIDVGKWQIIIQR